MICNACGIDFDPNRDPGAILIGSPKADDIVMTVKKYHICRVCEARLVHKFEFR